MAKEQGNQLTDEFVRELRDMLLWKKNFSIKGAGVSGSNHPGGAAYLIQPPQLPTQIQRPYKDKTLVLNTTYSATTGCYNATLLTNQTSSIPASSTLAASDFGTTSTSSTTCVAMNAYEIGGSGYLLTPDGSTPYSCWGPLGTTSSGTQVYGIDAYQYTTICTTM